MGGQRRKRGGRVTPKGCASIGRLTPGERDDLEDIFERMLRSALKDLADDLPPLEVEMWASQMWSIWAKSELIGMDAVDVFAGGLINYATTRTTPAALMVLRALGAVAPEPYGSRARRGADRLASGGVAERRWARLVGTGQPTVAWLSYDPIDDDGVSVMVGYDGPGEPSTIGVYIDHNLAGMAKEVFAAPAGIDEVLLRLQDHEGPEEPSCREISLEEAGARWRDAFEMTDMTFDPPTGEDFDDLSALVMARLARLPRGGQVPNQVELGDEGREELLGEFLESDELAGPRGSAGADREGDPVEGLAHQILSFSLDYNIGTPLRFSPVMVEIFCLDWAPRKIAVDGHGLTLLPDVLAAWIRFVGRRRGLPEESIKAAVQAGYEYSPEMIELCQEPQVWGPAKTIALALQQRGIAITDQTALNNFVAQVNRSGGIDALADALAASIAPRAE